MWNLVQPFYKGIHSESTDDRSLLCSDLSSVYLVVSVIRSVLMTLTTTQAVDAHTYGSTTILVIVIHLTMEKWRNSPSEPQGN